MKYLNNLAVSGDVTTLLLKCQMTTNVMAMFDLSFFCERSYLNTVDCVNNEVTFSTHQPPRGPRVFTDTHPLCNYEKIQASFSLYTDTTVT